MMNMKRHHRILAALLCALMVLGAGACGKSSDDSSSASSSEASGTQSSSPDSADSELAFPLTGEGETLTYYVAFSGNNLMTGYAESELYKELEARTNVHIEFESPSGDVQQAFQLRITSDSLPDIMENVIGYYTGGLQGLINDEYAIRLNDLVSQYAPDYQRLLDEHEDFRKDATLDSGDIGAFYMCAYDYTETKLEDPWAGLKVRSDWLTECDLEVPTTIEELTNVLRTFKEKKGASAPMSGFPAYEQYYDFILGAWNISHSFFQRDGKVDYGPITEEFKEYILQMKSWYDEGLLDKEYLTRDSAGIDVLIGQDQVGVFQDTEIPEVAEVQQAIPFPALEKGATRALGMSQSAARDGVYAAFITTSCKNPELATKWLNYAYSREGALLFNYGIEGTTYTLDSNGDPQYTDLVTVEGVEDAKWWSYCNGYYSRINGPMLKWFDAIPSYHIESNPARENGEVWATGISYETQLPNLTLSMEDSQRLSTIMADIDTYVEEQNHRFIMGLNSMDDYDAFVAQIKSYGIDEAIELYQKALDAYNAR
ncbi:MAG: extracellular solute-binding protein [Clostridia bacterium]